ncbi:MAG: hypothetical protein GX369_02275 [Euryarchaeota archaeon]|nr:hypothetical protein [Euryarchaeota archaeon]
MGSRVMQVERKVPGGKLVQMTSDSKGSIHLTGDFFLHPEDELNSLEEFLTLLPSDNNINIVELIREYIEMRNICMIGLRPEDLAELLFKVRI